MANVVRVVLNSSNGRWYRFERDGDRLLPLSSTGVALTADDGNEVWVYRVTNERGGFQAMVASVAHPATLKVYTKDSTGNLALKEEVGATVFSTDHIAFPLAESYLAHATQEVQLDFRDGTVGTLTASEETVTLYEKRIADPYDKEGAWKIIAALVTEIEDKRVVFESSDPSIVRVERGAIALSTYGQIGASSLQTDQYCVIVGVRVGTATITCRSAIDGTLTDEVAVTVARHPDDPPLPAEGSPADLVEDAFRGVVVGMSSAVDLQSRTTVGDSPPFRLIDVRDIPVPGGPEDLFKVTLSYAGTVPKWHQYSSILNAFALFVGITGRMAFGNDLGGDDEEPAAANAHALGGQIAYFGGYDGAKVLNHTGTGTEVLNTNFEFFLRGGDMISFGWAHVNNNQTYNNGGVNLPAGEFPCEFNMVVDTHYPPNS